MFDAGMRTTLAQRLVSIVLSVFDQTCFNRLAAHFKISMFGHQTMFDGFWSPNISRLPRPYKSLVQPCQPHFDYCNVVSGNGNKGLFEKLQRLQNRAARALMSFFGH